jgi:hypothetical protein
MRSTVSVQLSRSTPLAPVVSYADISYEFKQFYKGENSLLLTQWLLDLWRKLSI